MFCSRSNNSSLARKVALSIKLYVATTDFFLIFFVLNRLNLRLISIKFFNIFTRAAKPRGQEFCSVEFCKQIHSFGNTTEITCFGRTRVHTCTAFFTKNTEDYCMPQIALRRTREHTKAPKGVIVDFQLLKCIIVKNKMRALWFWAKFYCINCIVLALAGVKPV